MTNRVGPKVIMLDSCMGCEHFRTKNNKNLCEHLQVKLNTKHSVVFEADHDNGIGTGTTVECPIPDQNCPFSTDRQLEFYKSKVKELEQLEAQKLKKIIKSIFKDIQDYTIDEASNSISWKDENSIDLDQLKQFQELLPDYHLTIDTYDTDYIFVEIYKRTQ